MICRLFIAFALMSQLLPVGLANIRPRDPVRFSFRSLIETMLPGVKPVLDGEVQGCEVLKSMFGITYRQMLEKNATSFMERIHIDYITANETIKYNITSSKKLNKLVKKAENVVVFVHGFMESSDGMMVQALVPEFLKQNSVALLALDGKDVITLEYGRSTTYARFMGELLGTVLIDLIEDGQNPAKIHLIGHSLGSHIVGRAGKYVQENSGKVIGRITGLDPAGPCFSSVGPEDRLDVTDAEYVDIIHSNAGRLGITDPIGHKDFYPNGGKSQPGCLFFICDHSRAWELFAESINSPKAFPARQCGNWSSFKEGRCRRRALAHLGYHSPAGSPGLYFLSTASSSPYNLKAAGSA